jgi:predicted CopG family antitoxin
MAYEDPLKQITVRLSTRKRLKGLKRTKRESYDEIIVKLLDEHKRAKV